MRVGPVGVNNGYAFGLLGLNCMLRDTLPLVSAISTGDRATPETLFVFELAMSRHLGVERSPNDFFLLCLFLSFLLHHPTVHSPSIPISRRSTLSSSSLCLLSHTHIHARTHTHTHTYTHTHTHT